MNGPRHEDRELPLSRCDSAIGLNLCVASSTIFTAYASPEAEMIKSLRICCSS